MSKSSRQITVHRVGASSRNGTDRVAVEEPLEIRLADESLVVTMRTPGHDEELALGFLFGEGIISGIDDVRQVALCDPTRCKGVDPESAGNVLSVQLTEGAIADRSSVRRNFYASSSCGVCGKASIKQVRTQATVIDGSFAIDHDVVSRLPDIMRASQVVFDETGGLHGAGLFDRAGHLICVREDVGRHNAVDKVMGWAVRERRVPLGECILLVSGRTSFEIVQKAMRAGVPILAAVSAASSLAVDLAREAGQTLIGFLRNGCMTVYCGDERIKQDDHD